jgi:hypothetical protein
MQQCWWQLGLQEACPRASPPAKRCKSTSAGERACSASATAASAISDRFSTSRLPITGIPMLVTAAPTSSAIATRSKAAPTISESSTIDVIRCGTRTGLAWSRPCNHLSSRSRAVDSISLGACTHHDVCSSVRTVTGLSHALPLLLVCVASCAATVATEGAHVGSCVLRVSSSMSNLFVSHAGISLASMLSRTVRHTTAAAVCAGIRHNSYFMCLPLGRMQDLGGVLCHL